MTLTRLVVIPLNLVNLTNVFSRAYPRLGLIPTNKTVNSEKWQKPALVHQANEAGFQK